MIIALKRQTCSEFTWQNLLTSLVERAEHQWASKCKFSPKMLCQFFSLGCLWCQDQMSAPRCEIFEECFCTLNLALDVCSLFCDHTHPAGVKQSHCRHDSKYISLYWGWYGSSTWKAILCLDPAHLPDSCSRVLINVLGVLLRMKPAHCWGRVCHSSSYAEPLKRSSGSVAVVWGCCTGPFLEALPDHLESHSVILAIVLPDL